MKQLLAKIFENVKRRNPVDIQAFSDMRSACVETLRLGKTALGVEYLKKLSAECADVLASCDMELGAMRDLYVLHKRVVRSMARDDFDSYLRYVEWDREPERRFYEPRRDVLLRAVNAMQDMADNKIDLLTISMPPGTGKLISDDTPVRMKRGWKQHGELKVKDWVIGADMKPRRVLKVGKKHIANYEVEFTNGDRIKCHKNHLWPLYDGSQQNKAFVLSVGDILKAGLKNETGEYNFSVVWSGWPDPIYICGIEKIKPVEGNCIEVERGFYRVGPHMIPTHNSTLGIFYLTWMMGKYPDGQNLASAHSGMLTRSFYDGVYQIITDPEYLWPDVFPGITIAATNTKEETIDLNKRHRFSTLTCRAINASLTGATRCDKILYADDLCSGIEEAMSKTRLDKLWVAYTNDLKSRKKEGAKEIHIATRWSVHDVIGRLEQQYGGDPKSRFISLPAVKETGESNFNYAYGVGFSKEYFDDMKANLDEASFKALYMNEPIEREGLLYHVDELQRYFELPESEPDAIIGVCDTKDKGTDYAVLIVAYVYGNSYYIEDCVCDNGLPNIVDARLVDILMRHHVYSCRFESNSAGGRVAEKVQAELKKLGGNTQITTKFTSTNKETRIITTSAFAKERFIFKDPTTYRRGSEYSRFMDLLCSYTVAGKNRWDDVPDAVSMLVQYAESMSRSKIEIIDRPF